MLCLKTILFVLYVPCNKVYKICLKQCLNVLKGNRKMGVILEASGITKFFPGVVALDDVGIVCKKGTVHCIVGENGAGKSTLVKILTGIYYPDKGKIIIEGADAFEHPEVFDRVAYAPQELQLFDYMTVGENLLLPFRGKDFGRFFWSKRRMFNLAAPLLEKFRILEKVDDLVYNIPPSSKQLLQIARAIIVGECNMVILDEPTTSLTIEDTKLLFEVITQLRAEGKAVIYISHKLDEVFTVGDEITVLRDGKKVGYIPRIADTNQSEIIKMMSGKEVNEQELFRPSGNIGDIVLEVKNLCGHGFRDVSFELRRGEILGFYGLVGSGRSEIMQTIMGYRLVKGGEVRIDGKLLKLGNPSFAIRKGLFYLPEERKQQGLFPLLSVRHNIGVALGKKILNGFMVSSTKERSVAEELVKIYSIKTPSVETPIMSLSGGNQQKVIVGRVMFCSPTPKVIIFDEPTKGIDVMAKREIYRIMKSLADEEGMGIILISSELEELLRCCSRIITLYRGTITGEFDPSKNEVSEIIAATINIFDEARNIKNNKYE
ncbi:MAG: ribose transport system ATP-binding protein [Candidatus Atribacteria bacterium]|nr:ribose transport system ATP-binding protein [Candidatus Atribacteria bacterium]